MTSLIPMLLSLLVSAPVLAGDPWPVDAPWWRERHEEYLRDARTRKIDVLFLGDSITDLWRHQGKTLWDEQLAPLGAVNFGIGGDSIENVLWRIENGEIDGIAPHVVVLLIGTNNLPYYGVEEINQTYDRLIGELRQRLPRSKLLLLAIFPRVDDGSKDCRQNISAVNASIARHAEGDRIRFLDFGARFLSADGSISREIMYDGLHLSEQGYRIWLDAMLPVLKSMLRSAR